MRCGGCDREARPGARFCDGCGQPLELACAACAHVLRFDARFCDACGTSVAPSAPLGPAAAAPAGDIPSDVLSSPPAEPSATSPAPAAPPEPADGDLDGPQVRLPAVALNLATKRELTPVGERKQVTVLFSDVEGSMELAERLDTERWQEIMNRFFALFCEVVDRYEGTVHQFVGDGAIAYFGAPIAHEDHAHRACVAALDLVAAFDGLGRELRESEAIDFHVRSGLNSGSVVVGAVGQDANSEYVAIGHTVGLAQRMQTLADPDTACISEHTAALVRSSIALRPRGSFAVKGAREPIAVFEIEGIRGQAESESAGRELPLVGRVIELAVLDAALRRAASGDGQAVTLVGDAGIGKHRVMREFAERARNLGLKTVTVGALAHERHVPGLNFQLLVHRFLGTDPAAPEPEQRERIGAALAALDPRLGAELPLLLDLLGLGDGSGEADGITPESRRRRIVRLLGRLLRARTREEPLLFIVENLQWLDNASAERMADLVSAIQGAAAMLAMTARPEWHLPWTQEAHVHVQRLGALNAAEQRSLLEDVLGDDPSLGDVGERLVHRADGNPLFLMEAVRALVDAGTLTGELGAYRLVAAMDEGAIPPTVEAMVAARIDRLPEREKSVLQAAAVVGEEFDDAVLLRVTGMPLAELEDVLEALAEADLLRRSDQGHAFRQTVVQEVAYRQQLERRRRALHGAAAAALADVDGELSEEHLALIASHAERAGELVPAAEWHAQAARFAREEPVREREHWRSVRRLLDSVVEPDTWLDRLALTSRVHLLELEWRLGADPEQTAMLHREARELAWELKSPTELVSALVGRSAERAVAGDLDECLALSAEALDVGRGAGDVACEVRAGFIAVPLALTGRLTEAQLQLDRTIELSRDTELRAATALSGAAWAHHWRARVSALRGDLPAARADLTTGLALARTAGDGRSECWTQVAGALVRGLEGDEAAAAAHLQDADAIAATIDDPTMVSCVLTSRALLQIAAGRADAALEHATRAVTTLRSSGRRDELWLLDASTALAAALLLSGDPAAARREIEETIAKARVAHAVTLEIPALLTAAHIDAAEPDADRLAEGGARVERGLALVSSAGAVAFAPALHAAQAMLSELKGDRSAAAAARADALAASEHYGTIARPLWRPAPLGPATDPARRGGGGGSAATRRGMNAA